MSKYAEMTDDELNKRVAERQGWKLTGEFVWEYVTPYGKPVDINDYRWASNLNAAAALDFGEYILDIRKYAGRITAEVFDSEKPETAGHVVWLYQDSRPEARVRTELWLMYRDAVSADS